MPLKKLIESVHPAADRPGAPDIQQTTLGLDLMSRFICSTWEEATANAEGIDVVVIGAGMYGGYCASKVFELSKARFGNQRSDPLRVLVLDAGPFIVPEHNQNIPDLGLPTPSVFDAKSIGSGTNPQSSNIVWGFGWRSNQRYSEQAYCVGGKGIYWGGWCPRLQRSDLEEWPAEVRDYLTVVNPANPIGKRPLDHKDPFDETILYRRDEALNAYETLEYEIGVKPTDDFIFDPVNISQTEQNKKVGLNAALHFLLNEEKANIDKQITDIIAGPVAVQTQSFVSGLFGLDKYSSLPALSSSIRKDHSNPNETNLRISLVPFSHVVRLDCAPAGEESPIVGTRLVNRIIVNRNGKIETLNIHSHCQVVLALSCIESTRLALESFSLESSLLRVPGQELMGRNFMVHLRADFVFKIESKKFAEFVSKQWPTRSFADVLQTALLHIQCQGQHGTYQYQLFAATNVSGPDSDLYRMIPDIDVLNEIKNSFNADFISFVLRSSGEVKGGRNAPYRDPNFDFIDLAGDADFDALFGHKRSWAQFKTNDEDHFEDPIWQDMHDTAHKIANALANGGQLIYNGFFSVDSVKQQQKLGTSWHDSGTLWMGDPETSVTDVNGHFHHVTNAYCADQSLFTTVGSANPVLTGLCLARKVADNIVSRHGAYTAPPSELAGFQPISVDINSGWLATPYRGVYSDIPGIIEMNPQFQGEGRQTIGIYYLPQIFKDFELIVEWKAFRAPVFPNSGVLLRMPDPSDVNFDNVDQFEDYYRKVIEIQIDDLGKNFSRNRTDGRPKAIFGDSLYKTGAIYGIAPARQWASKVLAPDGNATAERYWNVYQITARGKEVSVRLNGKLVSSTLALPEATLPEGYIGFQFHTGRVQFRNLKIKAL